MMHVSKLIAEAMQAIQCLDGRILPDNMVREAIGKIPSMDEVAAVKAAVRDAATMDGLDQTDIAQRLGPAEAYVFAVSAVPHLTERLRAMDFIASFTEAATSLQVLHFLRPFTACKRRAEQHTLQLDVFQDACWATKTVVQPRSVALAIAFVRVCVQELLDDLDATFAEAKSCSSLHGSLVLTLAVANRLRLQGCWPRYNVDGSVPDLSTMIARAVLLTSVPAILDTRTFNKAQSRLVHYVVAMCVSACRICMQGSSCCACGCKTICFGHLCALDPRCWLSERSALIATWCCCVQV
jgi:hypothetical protein